jgi:hypothetical protein
MSSSNLLFAKYVQGAPLQVDISTNFMFNDKFVGGVAYRWECCSMLWLKVNDQWFIGYSYDFDTTRLANYNSGSHELFLRYELFNRATRVICPRFLKTNCMKINKYIYTVSFLLITFYQ